MLLGAQRERVHVDTRRRRAAVVLEGLDLVEVRTFTFRETVLAVQLELGDFHGILALATNTRVQDHLGEQVVHTRLELGRTSLIVRVRTNQRRRLRHTLTQQRRRLRTGRTTRSRTGSGVLGLRQQRHNQTLRGEVIGVVEGLGAANGRDPQRIRAVNERVTLDDPEELLHGVIEVELDLVGRRRDRLRASVLDLLNQVLMGLLGEAAALLRVEVHIVNIQRRSGQGLRRRSNRVTDGVLVVLAVLPRLEVDVDAHLVVLEGNQGNRQTRVAAEPELERNV